MCKTRRQQFIQAEKNAVSRAFVASSEFPFPKDRIKDRAPTPRKQATGSNCTNRFCSWITTRLEHIDLSVSGELILTPPARSTLILYPHVRATRSEPPLGRPVVANNPLLPV